MRLRSPEAVENVTEFLGLARLIEEESAERYTELADAMSVHNDPTIEAIFRKLAASSERHAAELEDLATEPLPRFRSLDFDWEGSECPETADHAAARFQMTRRETLEQALETERSAEALYRRLASSHPSADVRRIATGLADEERQHGQWIEALLADVESDDLRPPPDLDPPHSPD